MLLKKKEDMSSIKKLTQEQWDYIPEHMQKYVDMVTKPIDKDRFKRALAKMYQREGLALPLVLFFDSPLSCEVAEMQLPTLLSSQLYDKLHNQIINQFVRHPDNWFFSKLHDQLLLLNSQLDRQLHKKLIRKLYNKFNITPGMQLHGQLLSQLHSKHYNQLLSQLHRQIGNQLEGHFNNTEALGNEHVRFWSSNIWWLDQACCISFMKHISVEFEEETYTDFVDFCEETIFGIPYPSVYIASEKPVEVHWQNNLLHNDNGPAILFRDSYVLYALNGVLVERIIVETPADELDPELAIKEENVEARREIIRKIGIERFIYQLGAETIDKWGDYELLDLSKHFRDMLIKPIYLKMKNPSTGTWYVEGIPPKIKTCKEALSWRICGHKWNPTQIT